MSHRLDYRSKQYGLGGKLKMEMQDWIDIVEGRISPEDKMIPYGLKDCNDNEVIFWNDLPYINLPKATINKILKLIVGMTDRKVEKVKSNRPYCKHCAKKRQSRFDVKVHEDGTGIHIVCNRCGESS